jgi:GNAT superfamily N-acetyltransferase
VSHPAVTNKWCGESRIIELDDPAAPYLLELERLLRHLLPGLKPSFREILADRRDDRERIKAQIFVGLCADQVAGLMQMFYRPWRCCLVANVDLLAVLEPFRRTNLGLGLIRHAITTALKVSSQYKLPVAGIVWLTEPEQGSLDSWANRRVRMFQKLGGQARCDLRYRYDGQPYPNGELIFWYPLADEFVHVATRSLAWLLWQFGGLPEEEFVRRYGDPKAAREL